MFVRVRGAGVAAAFQRKINAKSCAVAELGLVVDRAIVHLHGAERAGEADAASAGTRGEKKLEDARAMFGGDAFAGVADANFGGVTMAFEIDRERTAAGHGVNRVQNQIEERLMQK